MSYTATLIISDDVTWKGWGCSLAWWANKLTLTPYGDQYADLFFTTKDVAVVCKDKTVTAPGLGLNVVRYNIGGGGKGNIPYNLQEYKDIPGYWVGTDPFSSEPDKNPASSDWNWWADSNQRNMMWKARERGMSELQFFSDSPMWWMTKSKSTTGAAHKYEENLDPAYESHFCHYLAEVVKYANTQWGVTVGSVEAFNEPSAGWWNYADDKCLQEGCNFRWETQARLIPQLRSMLNSAGQTSVKIAASDENNPINAKDVYAWFPATIQSQIDLVTTHSYYGVEPFRNNPARAALRTAIGNKELWVTEYGDEDGTGQWLCTTITTDIFYMRPSAWCYWQVIEPDFYKEPVKFWGLLNADYGTGQPAQINNKYYVFATFTRHIRRGMKIWQTNAANTIFAWDAAQRQLVVLAVNYETAQDITFDLSALPAIGTAYTMVRTTFDGSERLQNLGTVQLDATQRSLRKFTVSHPANCVSVLLINIP